MDLRKAKAFIAAEWEPREFDETELAVLLDVSLEDAQRLIRVINAGASFPTVLHHDLSEYLKDFTSISRVPTSPDQVSKGAHWLVAECGWGFDARYSKYRYVDPQEPQCRYTLRGAIRVQFERDRQASPDVIDAECVVQPTVRLLEGPRPS